MAYTTIDDPSAYFKVQLYTGDGNASKAITFDDTDTNMQPDFVWIKRRNDADSHFIYDSVRFDGSNAYWLQANNTNLEGSDRPLTAFGSDGFTIGSNNSALNGNTNTYVSWVWKESATAGFDIVTYTGNGSNRTVSHSLSAKPDWMLHKTRDTTAQMWSVYHSSRGATKHLGLDRTNAEDTGSNYYQDTEPTSSVFSVGSESSTNHNGAAMLTYLWSEVKGFSKFGSYTGNGSTDGAFVYTGFKPAWVMIKRTDASANWVLLDNKRDPFNGMATVLNPDDYAVDNDMTDGSGNKVLDMLSNGFKIRDEYAWFGASGATYIYMAFAESPLVNSNGVPTNAR